MRIALPEGTLARRGDRPRRATDGIGVPTLWTVLVVVAIGVGGGALSASAQDCVHFVREWAPLGSGPGEVSYPWDLTFDQDGNVVIADTRNRRIQIFDTTGNFLGGWNLVGVPNTSNDGPSGIAIAANGNVYVTDPGTVTVQVYDATGNHINSWGQEGTEDDEFLLPRAIDIDADGNVYITDSGAVKVFGPTGTFRDVWRNGSGGAQFSSPTNISIGPNNHAYVSDIGRQTVQEFTLDGNLVNRWGSEGRAPEQFKTPLAIAFDADGNVWVIDHHNFRVQKFTADGSFLCLFAGLPRGTSDGQLVDPIGMAINDDGDIFITDFTNDGTVQHFHIADVTSVRSTTWSTVKTLYRSSADAR